MTDPGAAKLGVEGRGLRDNTIKRNLDKLQALAELPAIPAINSGKVGPKPKVYWLTEKQAVIVCLLSDAPVVAPVVGKLPQSEDERARAYRRVTERA